MGGPTFGKNSQIILYFFSECLSNFLHIWDWTLHWSTVFSHHPHVMSELSECAFTFLRKAYLVVSLFYLSRFCLLPLSQSDYPLTRSLPFCHCHYPIHHMIFINVKTIWPNVVAVLAKSNQCSRFWWVIAPSSPPVPRPFGPIANSAKCVVTDELCQPRIMEMRSNVVKRIILYKCVSFHEYGSQNSYISTLSCTNLIDIDSDISAPSSSSSSSS